jgi:RNA polymerase sigma-70 factor (ECF subfamily)
MSSADDNEVVEEFQNGNIDALGVLYDRYFENVYRFMYCKVGNRKTAEDLVQDTFRWVLESLPQTNLTTSFRSWLFGIARNVRAEYFRSKGRLDGKFAALVNEFITDDYAYDNEPIWENIDIKPDFEQLQQILEQLSNNSRIALLLRELDGLSIGEIATTLYGEDTPETRHLSSSLIYKAKQAAKKLSERM